MSKTSTIKDRILTLSGFLGGTKGDFFKSIGASYSNYKGKNLESKVGTKVVVEVLTKYPQVSAEWLLLGYGEMMKASDEIISGDENGIASITNLHSYATEESYTQQGGSISHEDEEGAKPFYDIDFSGGFDEVFNDQQAVPDDYIRVPGFERADCWCRLRGDSMYPEIKSGEIIALRECPPASIIYGNIYAVVMNDLRTVKQLRKAKSNEYLRFIPINSDKYDEQEFHKSEIIRVFEVLGSIQKFF